MSVVFAPPETIAFTINVSPAVIESIPEFEKPITEERVATGALNLKSRVAEGATKLRSY